MNIFQKLSWMAQMGIRDLCGELPHPMCKKGQPAVSSMSLDQKIQKSKSALSATATHPLGGLGAVPATVMCVLEMPSATEDRTGIPLSGEEGDLLKKMLMAIGLDVDVQTYVSYLSPWRAPGARVLTASEMQEGLSLLNERIRVVCPKALLLLGLQTVQALLDVPLGQARSKKHNYNDIPTFSTFAPGFLIKNPTYKKGAWGDLKKLQDFLDKNALLK